MARALIYHARDYVSSEWQIKYTPVCSPLRNHHRTTQAPRKIYRRIRNASLVPRIEYTPILNALRKHHQPTLVAGETNKTVYGDKTVLSWRDGEHYRSWDSRLI